ncbi:MAG: 2-dehydropantoate 2-reductase [Vicinamibacterales bacterium]|nr:2-dehydropantoate 2-reductase [Vicinamibacterales bacterium]
MKIVMFGSGGVGGYFGGRLAQHGHDVTFVARGAHLAALQAGGLRLVSPLGDAHVAPVLATADVSTIGPVDVVVLTVKMYDLEEAAAQLAPLLGPDTVVVTLQNGVEATAIVARHVGAAHVAGGVAYVAAVIDAPGVIRHTALNRLIFGELDGRPSPRLEAFRAALVASGVEAAVSPHIKVDLWSKFARLSVFSSMTTVTRSPIGVLRSDPDLLALLEEAVAESLAVGRAHGVPLSETVMEEIKAMVRDLPPNAKASMLEDLERGRRLELPWLSGAVVRLGREVGVPTPIHRFVATVLKPYQDGHA